MTEAESQRLSTPPLVTPYKSEIRDPVKMTMPPQSTLFKRFLTERASDSKLMKKYMPTSAGTPRGRLIQKILGTLVWNQKGEREANILQLDLPAIAAPIKIPLIRPSAEASAKIPIYFPRSRRVTMSVIMMLPTACIPPDPRPWNCVTASEGIQGISQETPKWK
jgi:hypothetical protein